MSEQWWSWVLTLVGVTCFFLAGRKVWWAWYVGLAGQITWLLYSLITEHFAPAEVRSTGTTNETGEDR